MTNKKAATGTLALTIFLCTSTAGAGRQIFIAPADIASLVAVVTDPANAGVTVVLAPGVYSLVGPLELQPNMQLVGTNRYQDIDGDGVWDARTDAGTVFAEPASETILDATNVFPDLMIVSDCGGQQHLSSIIPPLLRVRGGNVVRGLTISGARGPAIAPTIDRLHLSGDGADFEVTDTIFRNNLVGIGAVHHDCTFAGAQSSVTIERNVFINNQGGSIVFRNMLASGARWRGQVRSNRVSSSGVGMVLDGGACDEAEISVVSAANVFERNSIGVIVQGGRDLSANVPGLHSGANGNRLEWSSHSDAIWNNTMGGGIRANGAVSSHPDAQFSNENHVRLTLLDTRFIQPGAAPAGANRVNGQRRDVTLSGGMSGTGNEIRALLRRVSSDGTAGSFVISETTANVVKLIGSDIAFVHANDNVWLPQEP